MRRPKPCNSLMECCEWRSSWDQMFYREQVPRKFTWRFRKETGCGWVDDSGISQIGLKRTTRWTTQTFQYGDEIAIGTNLLNHGNCTIRGTNSIRYHVKLKNRHHKTRQSQQSHGSASAETIHSSLSPSPPLDTTTRRWSKLKLTWPINHTRLLWDPSSAYLLASIGAVRSTRSSDQTCTHYWHHEVTNLVNFCTSRAICPYFTRPCRERLHILQWKSFDLMMAILLVAHRGHMMKLGPRFYIPHRSASKVIPWTELVKIFASHASTTDEWSQSHHFSSCFHIM